MFCSLESKKKIIRQLKISLGQLKSTMEMVRQKRYCLDIVHQSQAIRGAMRRVDKLIIREYLESYVAPLITNGQGDQAMSEIKKIFNYA